MKASTINRRPGQLISRQARRGRAIAAVWRRPGTGLAVARPGCGMPGRRARRKSPDRPPGRPSSPGPPVPPSRLMTCSATLPGRRRRNSTERSVVHRESRKNYFPRSSATRRRRSRRGLTYHRMISVRPIHHHLRRNNLAMNYQGLRAVFGLEPDKTRIFSITCFRLRGGSTVIHRERHSGHPWRWIQCSAGIGPHGAVAVGTVVRRASRSLSLFRWRWD